MIINTFFLITFLQLFWKEWLIFFIETEESDRKHFHILSIDNKKKISKYFTEVHKDWSLIWLSIKLNYFKPKWMFLLIFLTLQISSEGGYHLNRAFSFFHLYLFHMNQFFDVYHLYHGSDPEKEIVILIWIWNGVSFVI